MPLRSVIVSLMLGVVFEVNAGELPPAMIGPVLIGQSETEVEAVLGMPLSRTFTGDALNPELKYEGLTIWLWDMGPVTQIRSTAPGYCTPDNICPGMKLETVNDFLASRLIGENQYRVNAETCWLEIEINMGFVEVLEIKCQP